jgi:hypothetical protein
MKTIILFAKSRLLPLALAAGLGACATVQYTPAQLSSLSVSDTAEQPARTLAQAASFSPDNGYRRELRAGSGWRHVGTIPEGDVYRPVGDVFTIEAADVHEAYLVVRGDALVGFYLPAKRGFSPLSPPQPLRFKP